MVRLNSFDVRELGSIPSNSQMLFYPRVPKVGFSKKWNHNQVASVHFSILWALERRPCFHNNNLYFAFFFRVWDKKLSQCRRQQTTKIYSCDVFLHRIKNFDNLLLNFLSTFKIFKYLRFPFFVFLQFYKIFFFTVTFNTIAIINEF